MADQLRRWAIATAASLATVAVLLLPPTRGFGGFSGTVTRRPSDRTPSELIEENLGRELMAASFVMKRSARFDSIQALLAAAPPSPKEVSVLFPPTHDDSVLKGFRAVAERELDRPRPRREGIPVALVGLPADFGRGGYSGPAYPEWEDREQETYFVPGPAGGYCAVLIPTPSGGEANWWEGERDYTLGSLDDSLRTTQLLGPCRFYGRYGVPGPSVKAWLQRVGHGPAQSWARPFDSAQVATRESRRLVFGLSDYWEFDLPVEGCLSGKKEDCRRLMLDGRPRPSRSGYGEAWSDRAVELAGVYVPEFISEEYQGFFGDRFILSDLENWYGEDQFQRFWSSEEPVEVAFQTAFGLSVGEWYFQLLDRDVGAEVYSPRLSLSDLLLSLALITGLVVVVAYVAQRRQVS